MPAWFTAFAELLRRHPRVLLVGQVVALAIFLGFLGWEIRDSFADAGERLREADPIDFLIGCALVEAGLSAISGVIVFVVSLFWTHGVDAPLAPLIVFAVVVALLLHPRIFQP